MANALATIDQIAQNTQFGTKRLLDGSAGLSGTASNGNVTVLAASSTANAGTYAVDITTAAQRASVTAGSAQTGNLAAAETLNVNGVAINLSAGSTQTQVQATINQYTAQTGVVAEDYKSSQSTASLAGAQTLTSTTGEVTQQTLSNTNAFQAAGGGNITASTTLIGGFAAGNLIGGTDFSANDVITFTGKTATNNNINGTFTVVDGTKTVGQLVAAINTAITGAGGGAVASVQNGKIVLTAAPNGSTPLALTLTNTTNAGRGVNFAGNPENVSAGGTAAGLTTDVNSLNTTTTALTAGDVIHINGTKSDGTAITQQNITYGTGKTIADILTAINTAYSGDATATYNAATGKFALTATNQGNTTPLALSITDTQGNTYGGFTAQTPVTGSSLINQLTSTTNAYGAGGDQLDITANRTDGTTNTISIAATNSTTVSDVVNALQTAFGSGYTASFNNATGQFTVAASSTAAQNGADQLTFTIADHTGNTGQSTFGANTSGGDLTRLRTVGFGAAATINVTSSAAASATSSGFGTNALTAAGVDVAGTIGGFAATGQGNVLTGSASAGAAGISLQITGLDPQDTTNTSTVKGSLGTVSVTNNSLVFQIGANAGQTATVALSNTHTAALGTGVTGNRFANLGQIDVSNAADAQDAISVIDQAINQVSTLDGTLGSFQQQTLQANANNLQTALTNTTSAESVIRDTDFAAETANYTKDKVLMQAGTTVLSYANQTNQLVVQLLQGH